MSKIYRIFLSYYLRSLKTKINLETSILDLRNKIINHINKMPDHLAFGIKLLSLIFIIKYFFLKMFLRHSYPEKVFFNLKSTNLQLFKNFIRFHTSIISITNVEEKLKLFSKNKKLARKINNRKYFDFIIVGSGPGGAIAALELQTAGFDTCIIENGNQIKQNTFKPFSYNEMVNQYKHTGITATLGNANIAYAEGNTFGGGSEINSGLYHRTPDHILDHWRKKFNLKNSNLEHLEHHFDSIEKDLHVSYFPAKHLPVASMKLMKGAAKLNWEANEIPRWFKYKSSDSIDGIKMTMSKTYLKKYLENNGEVFENIHVNKLIKKDKGWQIGSKINSFISNNVVLSAGTIGTPMILKNSGLLKRTSNNFQMHPTVKVVALFDEEVNSTKMGVPVHQVKEFSKKFSIGCSISSKPHLKLAMLDYNSYSDMVEKRWKNMAVYYIAIIPEGYGTITKLPFFNDPLIKYNLTLRDQVNIADGLKKLCQVLLAAGASELYPSIPNQKIIKNNQDIEKLPNILDPKISNFMTVHLFSSCPIGENKNYCIANSYGKVFNTQNLYISDASMIPSAPGVNPQGTIMALARKNIQKIISLL